jgi:O-acetyl-ADP-ribose deacetylase (regulator of RNase III)
MIQYTTGNILDAQTEALVNTVNEVGVMGKGVALMFREAFPANTKAYEAACERGEVRVGSMFVTANPALFGPRWIINFPTKRHWRRPSQMEWVRDGLTDLVRVIRKHGIASVALPPLGCGNGGLIWEHVRREIEIAASELPTVEFVAYEPASTYQNAPKAAGVMELTPARALIAEMVRRYCASGMDCSVLEVQKLAWFLQRALAKRSLDDPLHLKFVPDRYGPYADGLRHLLDALDGSYLHCERRLGDARPFDAVWFENARAEAVDRYLSDASVVQFREALEQTAAVVAGFESPLGLELLATVDYLLAQGGCEPTVAGVKRGIVSWPGGSGAAPRKARLFDDRLIGLALKRLIPENRRQAAT